VEHRDLTSLVMHDRNHPCIILWSLCNEQWTQGSPEGAAMARAMKQRVNELDPTRLVTAAMNGGFTKRMVSSACWTSSASITIPGFMRRFHAQFPTKPMVATEIASEIGTRGIYELNHWESYWGDKDRGYVAAYSINAGPGGQTVEQAWPPIATNDFMAGGFVWSGFDYKGEPRPFELAVHQLALRLHGHLRIPQGQLLLLPSLVDRQTRAAPVPALELAGQGRPGDSGVGAEQLSGSGTVSQRRFAGQTDRETLSSSRMEG
jgi:hypothetical protein